MLHIVIIGGPIEGFKCYGPFKTIDEAIDWAESEDDGETWWIVELVEP